MREIITSNVFTKGDRKRWEIRRQRGKQAQRRKWLHIHTNKQDFYFTSAANCVVEKPS